MSEEQDLGEEKSPWIWKAAIVALPVGLAISVVVALILKVSKGELTGMEGVTYAANDFSVANLRDATGKVEDSIGVRDFESEGGQKAMQQMVSFVEGSLSSINLGYKVERDEGRVTEGRIWKNYWVDSSSKAGEGTLVVWTTYSEESDSASVAALLSVAEWLRGRDFEKKIRVAFVRDGESIESVTADFSEKDDEVHFAVVGLGQGTRGLMKTGGPTQAERELAYYRFEGKEGLETASDWKLTVSWEHFEEQVRELCREISAEAGERVVFKKE